jgi:hypothetical protein
MYVSPSFTWAVISDINLLALPAATRRCCPSPSDACCDDGTCVVRSQHSCCARSGACLIGQVCCSGCAPSGSVCCSNSRYAVPFCLSFFYQQADLSDYLSPDIVMQESNVARTAVDPATPNAAEEAATARVAPHVLYMRASGNATHLEATVRLLRAQILPLQILRAQIRPGLILHLSEHIPK